MMNEMFSFDPFSSDFDPSSLLDELRKHQEGQVGVIGLITHQAGSSPGAKNKFSFQFLDENKPVNSWTDAMVSAQVRFQGEASTTWEYLCKVGPQENELEALGNIGWELCAVVSRQNRELWIFKRPNRPARPVMVVPVE